MFKHLLYSGVLLSSTFFLTACSGNTQAPQLKPLVQGVPDSLWKNNAVEGLRKYLDLIPPGEYTHYGFNNASELNQAYLGEPTSLVFAPGTSTLPDTTQILMIPIMVEGQNRVLLQMSLENGEWKANTLGSSGIAKRLQEIHESNPNLKKAPMFRVTWQSADYLLEPLPKGYIAHPLFSDNRKPIIWDSIPPAPKH